MGPIRGGQKGVKKRRKLHKGVEGDQNGAASAPSAASPASGSDEETDWFEEVADMIGGNLNISPSKGLDMFQTIFNMSRGTFEYICSLARDHMIVKTHFAFISGAPMTVHDQVALALRRLSSGSSLIQIGDSFQVHHSTVSQVTWRFVEAMETYGRKHLRWPTEQRLTEVKSKFEEIHGLPNCCGAVEISHVVMLVSTSEATASSWVDSTDSHSMLVMGVVDPDMRFLDVVAGAPGKSSDYEALYNSNLYEKCQNGDRLNSEKIRLGEQLELPEYIVGDSGFPLLPWLLTPYQETELSEARAEYNRALKEARKVAQRAFKQLKDVWKMIDGKMLRPDKHKLPRFIFVCCILHNIVIDMEDEVLETLTVSRRHDPGYRLEPCGYVDDSAAASRDMLSEYYYPFSPLQLLKLSSSFDSEIKLIIITDIRVLFLQDK